jgi:DNA-binding response OmpR family regulator
MASELLGSGTDSACMESDGLLPSLPLGRQPPRIFERVREFLPKRPIAKIEQDFGEGVTLDSPGRSLSGTQASVHLSPTEWRLLLRLIDDRGKVLTHITLLRDVWGPGYDDAHHLLHDTVSRLRHRFRAAGARADQIETVHAVGYRLRHKRSGDTWGDIPFAL